MLKIMDQPYYQEVVAFARSVGALDKLEAQLDYLGNFGGTLTFTECELYRDWAPYSFGFIIRKGGVFWFNGALIYSGPGQPLDGSAPAFTVSLTPERGHAWSVHT